MSDREFWLIVYRSLIAIAKAIAVYKLGIHLTGSLISEEPEGKIQ